MKQQNVTKPFPSSGAVSIDDVAQYLDISFMTVRRLMERDPTFPKPKRVLRSVKFNATEITHWFEKGK
jgi:predicted DNA-binding transcriptional regulator AlpA